MVGLKSREEILKDSKTEIRMSPYTKTVERTLPGGSYEEMFKL